MLNGLQPYHLIIILLLVVLLFGAKRLPDAARSIGKSMKIFKAETKSMDDSADGATEPETKQISSSTVQPMGTESQVADLQRQLDELKKQQATGDHPQKHVS
ncbi:Sec-independent protein translocase subunit TatA [Amycolatopsis pigmentata]|uniref:Sec-independent protein translocase protein TatA n=1 Tax=Amycolatopsis pigmentata TaxID=450801 RepID=A0ABW5FTF5_9PSEU